MNVSTLSELDYVTADLAYTTVSDETAQVRVFPPSSGRGIEWPPRKRMAMPIYNCRPVMNEPSLDEAGFEVRAHRSAFTDFYDPEKVKADYYPEVAAVLKEATGALYVMVFDHNVRNQARADRSEDDVREPVDGAHNAYTVSSGPRRVREILEENGRLDLVGRRAALINVWRPIVGRCRIIHWPSATRGAPSSTTSSRLRSSISSRTIYRHPISPGRSTPFDTTPITTGSMSRTCSRTRS